jgi:hypothetical protein
MLNGRTIIPRAEIIVLAAETIRRLRELDVHERRDDATRRGADLIARRRDPYRWRRNRVKGVRASYSSTA